VSSGYIKAEIAGETLIWHWTHNNQRLFQQPPKEVRFRTPSVPTIGSS
jgi:hypothetical protein